MTELDELIIREQRCQAAVERLATAYESNDRAKLTARIAFKDYQAAIAEAHHAGVSMPEIREVSGLTASRVYQIYEAWLLNQQIADQKARLAELSSQGTTFQEMLDRYNARLANEDSP